MPSEKHRKIWTGPKEWRPARIEPWLNSPLLSQEENKRISLLFAESKKTSSKIAVADAAWLCETIKRLAECGPEDYLFPPRLALFNPIAHQAYSMRYQETPLIEYFHRFQGPFLNAILFEKTTMCQPPEAHMLIRPYIKINAPSDPAAVLSLRRSTVAMAVDGEKVLVTPIDEHLIMSDGSFSRKNRWKFGSLSKYSSLFSACPMDSAKNCYSSLPEGIACPNGSMIVVSLSMDTPFTGEISLTTGLVIARYKVEEDATVVGVIP